MINSALNNVNTDTTAFIDLDTPPEQGASLDQIVKFIISEQAASIKNTLVEEAVEAGDLVLREGVRRTYRNVKARSVLKPPLGLPGPNVQLPIPPVIVPGRGIKQADDVVEKGFPQLELKDEIYAQGLLELILGFANLDKSILDDPFQPQQYAQAINKFLNQSGSDKETKDIADLLTALVQNQSNGLNYEQKDIE